MVLKIGHRDFIVQALQDSAIDPAIFGWPPLDPAVTAVAIGEHPPCADRVAAASSRHAGPVTADEILTQPIILRDPESGTRILATRFLDQIGEGRPYETIQMRANGTIKQSVIAGLGIAMTSQHRVTEELK